MREKSQKLFAHPFSIEYWKLSAKELTSTRMLVIAAILTAMRIAIKALTIPIGPDLNITFGFIVNSVGSMIYGPVMAIITSAVSDTLGCILFPSGTYFFPFIFVEIAGGVIFALFFYRAKITTTRILFGRFTVTLVCNILLNSWIMYYYYMFILGKSYTILSLPRMIKNLVTFPLQSLVLIILFNALLPITNRMQFTFTGNTKISVKAKDIVTLVIMTIVSALVIVLYYLPDIISFFENLPDISSFFAK